MPATVRLRPARQELALFKALFKAPLSLDMDKEVNNDRCMAANPQQGKSLASTSRHGHPSVAARQGCLCSGLSAQQAAFGASAGPTAAQLCAKAHPGAPGAPRARAAACGAGPHRQRRPHRGHLLGLQAHCRRQSRRALPQAWSRRLPGRAQGAAACGGRAQHAAQTAARSALRGSHGRHGCLALRGSALPAARLRLICYSTQPQPESV